MQTCFDENKDLSIKIERSLFYCLFDVAVGCKMSDARESQVPAWDGAQKGWRRYTREVARYVQSTPVAKRRHCASDGASTLAGNELESD